MRNDIKTNADVYECPECSEGIKILQLYHKGGQNLIFYARFMDLMCASVLPCQRLKWKNK